MNKSEDTNSFFCRVSCQLLQNLYYTCAVKGAGSLRVKVPPGNWFAPPGSNRSGGGGNEAVGASGVKGRFGDSASRQAVT